MTLRFEARMHPTRRLAARTAIVAGGAAAFALVGSTVRSCGQAERSATSFVAAVKGGRWQEANELATPRLRSYLLVLSTGEAPSEIDDRATTLRRIQVSHRVDDIGGYRGGFTAMCARVAVDGDRERTMSFGTSVWWVLRKIDGRWLVDDLGSTGHEPDLCTAEPP